MAQVDDGGPAYPIPWHQMSDGTSAPAEPKGMTLRDWFAGQALAGLLANPLHLRGYPDASDPELFKDTAEAAYEAADALIRDRRTVLDGADGRAAHGGGDAGQGRPTRRTP
jgi:hypothetical protein